MFEKGNKLGKLSKGGGRKKLPKTEIKDFLEKDREHLGEYLTKLGQLALNGDLDALKYLVDRHLGRPHQSIDQRIKGTVFFTPEDYALVEGPQEDERKMLKEWENTEG